MNFIMTSLPLYQLMFSILLRKEILPNYCLHTIKSHGSTDSKLHLKNAYAFFSFILLQTILLKQCKKSIGRIMNVVSYNYYDDCILHLDDEGIWTGDLLYILFSFSC